MFLEAGVMGKTVGPNRGLLTQHCGIALKDIIDDKVGVFKKLRFFFCKKKKCC
jgi:hypothetical protein